MDLKRKLARLETLRPISGVDEANAGSGPVGIELVPAGASSGTGRLEPPLIPAGASSGTGRLEPPLIPAGASQAQRLLLLRARLEELSAREPRVSTTVVPRRPAPPPEPYGLPGGRRDTPYGSLHAVSALLDPDHVHGEAPVAAALDARAADLAMLALDPAMADVDPARILYFDTETTGLAGGTGTLPFLIGLGWFEQGRLQLEQLLVTRPGEEGPILRRVAERVAAATCIASYNGKSFDWPLLRTRFILNRVALPEPPPHLDLLHCTRRVFRNRLGGVRLAEVESGVLGMQREGDIDGALIPALYWDFLRTGNGELLAPVITHNAYDVAALAALLGVMARQLAEGGAGSDPRDCLGYAHVARRARDEQRTLAFAAAAAAGEGEHLARALGLIAVAEQRRGNFAAAVAALEEALPAAPAGSRLEAELHLSLAKLYEHRLRDPMTAMLHARDTLRAEGREAHERRLARLLRRVQRGLLPVQETERSEAGRDEPEPDGE